MKRNNKKGFTIVELVIVIAVIAILAAVLIPTFGGVIETANKSAVTQKAAALYKEIYAIDLSDGTLDGEANGSAIDLTGYTGVTYTVDTDADPVTFSFSYEDTDKGYIASFAGDTWTISE